MDLKIKIGMNESDLSSLLERFCKKHGYEYKCAAELQADLSYKNASEYKNSNHTLLSHCTWLDFFILAWEETGGE